MKLYLNPSLHILVIVKRLEAEEALSLSLSLSLYRTPFLSYCDLQGNLASKTVKMKTRWDFSFLFIWSNIK